MSQNSKLRLIQKSLLVLFFGSEFALAFLGIATGAMYAYATCAVGGVLIPAVFDNFS